MILSRRARGGGGNSNDGSAQWMKVKSIYHLTHAGLVGGNSLADGDTVECRSDTNTTVAASPVRRNRLRSEDFGTMLLGGVETGGVYGEPGAGVEKGNSGAGVVAHVGTGGAVSLLFGRDAVAARQFSMSVVPAICFGRGDNGEDNYNSEEPRGAKVHEVVLSSTVGERGEASRPGTMNLLKPGDILTEVNGRSVRRLPFSDVVSLLNSGGKLDTSSSGNMSSRPHAVRYPVTPGTGRRTAPLSMGSTTFAPPSPTGTPPSPSAVTFKARPRSKPRGPFPPLSVRHQSCRGPSTAPFCDTPVRASMTPRTKERRGLARLKPWGGGGGGGGGDGVTPRRTPRSSMRPASLARRFQFSMTKSPKVWTGLPPERAPPPSRPLPPPSPPSATKGGEVEEAAAVFVAPAPMTTLRFCTGGHEGRADASATSEAEEEEEEDGGVRGRGEGFGEEEEQQQGDREDEERTKRGGSSLTRKSDSVTFFPTDDVDYSDGGEADVNDVALDSELSVTCSSSDDDHGVGYEEEEEEDEVQEEMKMKFVEEMNFVEETAQLSLYLSSAEGGWPWTGKDIIWAEYVSLNGHHRWIRSDGCRHALLLVRGAMFLVEMPAAAATTTNITRDGDTPLQSRGWFLKITASALGFLSVPLSPSQTRLGGSTFDWEKGATAGGCGDGAVGGMSGLILHGRRGGCAWVECGSADRRDALVDVVLAWHSAETKGSALKIERCSLEEASSKVTSTRGARYMVSLLTGIVSCSWV